MSPVSNEPSFDTIRWTTLSELRQVTMPPDALPGLGLKEEFPRSPTIVMAVVVAGGGVEPLGVVGGLE
jgi:hypothetical protein